MLSDSADLPDGSHLQADVAIVGAGPAGIVTALELGRLGLDVLLLESGGKSFDPVIQELGDLSQADDYHTPMSLATRRQVGGASIIWGGRCVPFDAIDFRPREHVPHSWPVAYEELTTYFQRACDWFVCGKAIFDARQVPGLAQRSLLPGFPEGAIRTTTLERWSLPTNFGRVYQEELASSAAVRLVTGLTCTEVVCSDHGSSVDRLEASSASGHRVTVQARRYVLACGGLETTRLLMASRRHHPTGIGNHSDHLGRWYMAHVECRLANAHFTTPPADTIYGNERDPDGVYVRRRFSFSDDFQREHGLPNLVMWLANPDISDASHRNGVLSFVYLMLISPLGRFLVAQGIREAHTRRADATPVWQHVKNILRDPGRAAAFALSFGYRRYIKRGRKVPAFYVSSAANVYPLVYHAEHMPDFESRVELSDELDAHGTPRLSVQLRFADAEIEDAIRAHEHLDTYLQRHGLGRLEYRTADLRSAVRDQLFGGYHQAGTTRMASRPEDGVVDGNLAVHGFDDLYVASSSTFVTSSQANSTFMIVVFALRLAERLRAELDDSRGVKPGS